MGTREKAQDMALRGAAENLLAGGIARAMEYLGDYFTLRHDADMLLLLRPADPPDTLLRPAPSTEPTPEERLLRPAEGE